MKKQLKKLNEVSSIILAFLLAIGIGALGREALVATNVIQPKQVIEEIKRDVLPLKNGGEVVIRKAGDKKIVYISYEDLKYISKKVKIKKLIKSLDALFARMEE